jgi:hypothetical protein
MSVDQHDNLDLLLFRYSDLLERKIVKNRMTLRRWMDRTDDPFPAPLVLTASARQNHSIAWKASEVESWLERRVRATKGQPHDSGGAA